MSSPNLDFLSPPQLYGKMAGTKRKTVTNAKQSALSKRHKTGGQSSSASAHKKRTAEAAAAVAGPSSSKPARASAFDGADGAKTGTKRKGAPSARDANGQTKKDRKGKGPAYIPVVRESDFDDSEDNDESASDAGMDVDDDFTPQADFLTRLDEKGMSA